MLKVLKTFKCEVARSYHVSIAETIDYLENRGFYKPGTVHDVMSSGGGLLETPFATYKIPAQPELAGSPKGGA